MLNLNSLLWNFTWKCHIFRSDLSKLFSGDSSFVENGFPIQSVCHITGIDTFVLEGSEKGANSMWNVSNLPWGGTSTNKRLFLQTIYKVNISIFWIMSSEHNGSQYYTKCDTFVVPNGENNESEDVNNVWPQLSPSRPPLPKWHITDAGDPV